MDKHQNSKVALRWYDKSTAVIESLRDLDLWILIRQIGRSDRESKIDSISAVVTRYNSSTVEFLLLCLCLSSSSSVSSDSQIILFIPFVYRFLVSDLSLLSYFLSPPSGFSVAGLRQSDQSPRRGRPMSGL